MDRDDNFFTGLTGGLEKHEKFNELGIFTVYSLD